MKQTRQRGSQSTLKGAALYDLLGREGELRERRGNVLARQLEIDEVEGAIGEARRSIGDEVERTNANIENVGGHEANLRAKIEKKRGERGRTGKGLRAGEGREEKERNRKEKGEERS